MHHCMCVCVCDAEVCTIQAWLQETPAGQSNRFQLQQGTQTGICKCVMDCLDETILELGNKWEKEQHEGMEDCIERLHRQDQCMHEQKEVELSAHWCVSRILVCNIPYDTPGVELESPSG